MNDQRYILLPIRSPEPTAAGAFSSAIAVRQWLDNPCYAARHIISKRPVKTALKCAFLLAGAHLSFLQSSVSSGHDNSLP